MITAVDTSVLLDVLADDPKHAAPSEALLARAWQQGSLIICPVVYAELAPHARDRRQLDSWLEQCGIAYVRRAKCSVRHARDQPAAPCARHTLHSRKAQPAS